MVKPNTDCYDVGDSRRLMWEVYASTYRKVESMTMSLQNLNNLLEESIKKRTAQLEQSQFEFKKANKKLIEISISIRSHQYPIDII